MTRPLDPAGMYRCPRCWNAVITTEPRPRRRCRRCKLDYEAVTKPEPQHRWWKCRGCKRVVFTRLGYPAWWCIHCHRWMDPHDTTSGDVPVPSRWVDQ